VEFLDKNVVLDHVMFVHETPAITGEHVQCVGRVEISPDHRFDDACAYNMDLCLIFSAQDPALGAEFCPVFDLRCDANMVLCAALEMEF